MTINDETKRKYADAVEMQHPILSLRVSRATIESIVYTVARMMMRDLNHEGEEE